MNDINAIKSLFGLTASTGKFNSDWSDVVYDGQLGIVNTEGQTWTEQRNFFIKTLKQLAVGNILVSIIKGERLTKKDTKLLEEIMHLINVTTKSGVAFIPLIKYIAPEVSGYARLLRNTQQMWNIVEEYVNQHRKRMNANNSSGEPSDIIDAYIERVENCKDPNSTFYGETGWKNVVSSIKTIIIAGTETTVSILHWLIFYLTVNEAVQKKLQEEVDIIVGSRQPTLLNKSRF